MGQSWALVNADKKQTTGYICKLGEFFFERPTWFSNLILPTTPTTIRSYDEDDVSVCGSWAGDRILCLGEYAEDLPEGFLTDSDSDSDMDSSSSSENLADSLMESCTKSKNFRHDSQRILRVWVLRNLSKREYVRSNGIPDHRNNMLVYDQDVGLAGTPGFSQVLLSRIGWSSDSSVSMPYEGPLELHRGPWAGDRFDVRVFDDVIESMKDEGEWVDLTRIVARDIYDLFKSEYDDYDGNFEEEPYESDEE